MKNNKSTGQKFECHDGPALHPCLYQSHITVEFTSILLPFRCLSAAPLRLALKSASADIPPTSPTRNQGLSLHKDRKLTGNTRNIDSKPNVAPSPRCSLSFLQTYTAWQMAKREMCEPNELRLQQGLPTSWFLSIQWIHSHRQQVSNPIHWWHTLRLPTSGHVLFQPPGIPCLPAIPSSQTEMKYAACLKEDCGPRICKFSRLSSPALQPNSSFQGSNGPGWGFRSSFLGSAKTTHYSHCS